MNVEQPTKKCQLVLPPPHLGRKHLPALQGGGEERGASKEGRGEEEVEGVRNLI
jgi:hypothetical protein